MAGEYAAGEVILVCEVADDGGIDAFLLHESREAEKPFLKLFTGEKYKRVHRILG